MKIKSIKNVEKMAGIRVLLRADFDVPVDNSVVKDDFRIRAALPMIKYLLQNNARIIIISHLGRPKNKEEKQFSNEPVAEHLAKLLDRKVKFIGDAIGFDANSEVSIMKDKEVILLENLRFYEGELKNSAKFAKQLAKLGNIYVNNAFAVSHRQQASISAIKKYLPAYAGLLLENEIIHLNQILHPQKPLITVLGGAKIKTKLPLLNKMVSRADKILLGGILANAFLASRGYEIGKSKTSQNDIGYAKKIKSEKIVLPVDLIVNSKRDGTGKTQVRKVNKVKKSDYIFDIGPQTIRLYSKLIKTGKTLVWNGPLGMFELSSFKHGTLSVARVIAARSRGKAFGVVGGGETAEALNLTKMNNFVDWVSTGGGAMLAYLGGEKMPGLKGIINY
jgi:phosphoglycerate kinase